MPPSPLRPVCGCGPELHNDHSKTRSQGNSSRAVRKAVTQCELCGAASGFPVYQTLLPIASVSLKGVLATPVCPSPCVVGTEARLATADRRPGHPRSRALNKRPRCSHARKAAAGGHRDDIRISYLRRNRAAYQDKAHLGCQIHRQEAGALGLWQR